MSPIGADLPVRKFGVRQRIRTTLGAPRGCTEAVAAVAQKGPLIDSGDTQPISRSPSAPGAASGGSARSKSLLRGQGMAFVVIGAINTLIGYFFFIGFELTVGP